MQEADILAGKTSRLEPAAEFRPSIGACSWYTEPLNKRISLLEDELKSEVAERQKLEAHILSWSGKAGESEDVLKNKETALEDSLRLLAERDAELSQRREREEELKRQVLHLSKRVDSLEHGTAQPKERGPLARMSTPAPMPEQPTRPRPDKAQVLQLKSQLAGKLKSVDKLIGERKTLIDQLKHRQKGIDIKIQPLVAKTGASLDSLRQRTQTVSELDEGLSLGAQINEIEGKLRDDIRVLERLTK